MPYPYVSFVILPPGNFRVEVCRNNGRIDLRTPADNPYEANPPLHVSIVRVLYARHPPLHLPGYEDRHTRKVIPLTGRTCKVVCRMMFRPPIHVRGVVCAVFQARLLYPYDIALEHV